jgi:6-phosphogluconolactonase (cycloisomerase 2 family)
MVDFNFDKETIMNKISILLAVILSLTAPMRGAFVFVSNFGDNSISSYSLNADGTLTSIGTFPAGFEPISLTVDPAAPFLYATIYPDIISEFAINSNGTLTPINTISTAGTMPAWVAITPGGQFAYAGSEYGTPRAITEYSIAGNGQLVPIGNIPGTSVQSITISPNGQFAYTTNIGLGTVGAYAITPNGLLSFLGAFAAGNQPYGITVTKNNRFLYATNSQSQSISAYLIEKNGLLAPIKNSPFPAGNAPLEIAITPNNEFLYTTNILSNTVSGYRINSSGQLKPIGVFPTGVQPDGIVATDRFVIISNSGESTMTTYAIQKDGTLLKIGSPVATGNGPNIVAIAP